MDDAPTQPIPLANAPGNWVRSFAFLLGIIINIPKKIKESTTIPNIVLRLLTRGGILNSHGTKPATHAVIVSPKKKRLKLAIKRTIRRSV